MGQMRADLSDDGPHPNAKGYRIMSQIALLAIGQALAGQREGLNESQSGKQRSKSSVK